MTDPKVRLTSLCNAREMSISLKGFLSPERVLELAEAGYLPHHRVDGCEPMFIRTEVIRYVEDHLIARGPGAPFPEALPVSYMREDAPAAIVPTAIKALASSLIRLPVQTLCGVYFLVSGDEVVYVGKSVNAHARIPNHEGVKDYDRVLLLPVPRSDLDAVECSFIRALAPRYNKRTGNGPRTDDEAAALRRLGVAP